MGKDLKGKELDFLRQPQIRAMKINIDLFYRQVFVLENLWALSGTILISRIKH